MGGFSPPVPQQDSNWEIRVVVLLSLLLQVLILLLGPMRKRSSSPVLLFIIWSCYLLADWVADLGLGLLLNNMGNISGNGGSGGSSSFVCHVTAGGAIIPAGNTAGSPIIFAFWAPFVLMHLGGQDTITAYSIQDNDLWLRHLIGLLFELFSACVIFFCSLEGNPMIPATVLIFVAGIIKYGERTYSLYSGSVDGVLAEIIGDPDPGPNYAKLMSLYDAKKKAGLDVEIVVTNPRPGQRANSLQEQEKETISSPETQAYKFFRIFRRLCFDVNLSYKERMTSQAYFLDHDDVNRSATKAFEVIELELNFIYDMVHTKEPIAHTKAGCLLRFVGSACIISALLIFFFHHKGGIARVDIAITYVLLIGGVTLDATALARLLVSNWTLAFLEESPRLAWLAPTVRLLRALRPRQRRWREDTSQLNLISYCVGDPYISLAHPLGYRRRWVLKTLTKVAETLHVPEIFQDLFFIRREPLSSNPGQGNDPLLFMVVFNVLKKTAIEAKKMKYEDMKRTCSYRGEGVLEDLRQEITEALMFAAEHTVDIQFPAYDVKDHELIKELVKEKLDILSSSVSVDKEFDESLLLWHVATDLCCHSVLKLTVETQATALRMVLVGRTLSEYMMYLLIKQPKILLASAGVGLKRYRDTCAEAKRFFESAALYEPDHVDARRMLLRVNTTKKPSEVKGDRSKSVLFDAVILAKVLRELGQDLMWEVIARVWGEMLTYAAGKCKGSTQVQQLSRGGELITMVWFLMAHMGLGDAYKDEPNVELVSKLIVHDH